MPHDVPKLEWTEDALKLRQHVFEHWCEHGVGPTLRDAHEATGLSRRQILQAYKQLQLGVVAVVDQDTQNCNLIKAPPFSSFPSQVKAYFGDRFHCFVGCAMEAIAVGHMPPFADRELRLESWCACCLEPITLVAKDREFVRQSHPGLLVHVSSSPWDWNNVDMTTMCDSMNFVIDAEHARRYEKQISRLGVVFTIPQARLFTKGVADARMWDYHWSPGQVTPGPILEGVKALGVDVTNWGG